MNYKLHNATYLAGNITKSLELTTFHNFSKRHHKKYFVEAVCAKIGSYVLQCLASLLLLTTNLRHMTHYVHLTNSEYPLLILNVLLNFT